MKTLLIMTTLAIACALSVPAAADRWQKGHYRDDYRYENRYHNHRHHEHRYCDDRRHDRHYTHYRGKSGVKVIIKNDRYKSRDRHVIHHHDHRDDETLKWIAGTLIVREILR